MAEELPRELILLVWEKHSVSGEGRGYDLPRVVEEERRKMCDWIGSSRRHMYICDVFELQTTRYECLNVNER